MNENSGETPNPLNQNSEPINTPPGINPSEPANGIETGETITVGTTASEQQSTIDPAEQTTNDPMARPMEKAPTPEAVTPPKQKKTGLIVGIIVGIVVLIIGIVVAVLLLGMNRGDAVSKAMAKVINGEMPENITVNGTFNFTPSEDDSMVSNVKLMLKSDASTRSLINSSEATLTATLGEYGDISLNLSEIFAENGDLYLKIDGITAAVEDYTKKLTETTVNDGNNTDGTDVISGSEIETDNAAILESISALTNGLEIIDGEWLRISTDEIATLSQSTFENTDTACTVSFISDLKNNSNSVAQMYNNNPFIASTTEGVSLASKSGSPVYEVVIDQENFSGFMSAMQSSTMAENLYSCMGYQNGADDIDDLTAKIEKLPTLYVEVDDNYNFTRLYFENNDNENGTTLTADLEFSYPGNINVAEPTEYEDFSKVIEKLFTSMYALPANQVNSQSVME